MFTTTEQMHLLEALTDQGGVSYAEMMQRAGHALAETIAMRYPDKKIVLFLAGKGNNGGDCYAAAVFLKKAGWKPEILAPNGNPGTPAARAAYEQAKAEGIPIYGEAYDFLFGEPDIVVDGLFGTGFKGTLDEHLAALLAKTQGKIHVACDIPSGGNADTGAVCPGTFPAELTVTFGAVKLGMTQYPLLEYCGEIVKADIGIPASAFDSLETAPADDLKLAAARALLPVRRPDAHKHMNGHLLSVTGSVRMRGAAVLSAGGAMRMGVGLATCASAEPVVAAVCSRLPEVMCLPLAVDAQGFLQFEANKAALTEALQGKQALLLGCGLGVTEETKQLTEFLLKESTCPVILDADGLNGMGTCIEWIPEGRTVLTPHPAEAARLLGISTAEVQRDRPGTAKKLAAQTGAVVVLKGAGTVVTDGKRMAVCRLGNAGMARAGSGDVLAGMLAALAAQGMPLYEAACTAVTLHAAAGDHCAKDLDELYMLPQDLLAALPEVL